MARLHIIWGLVFFTIFLATGYYMRTSFPDLHQGDPTMRMLFRSAHVYILLAAVPQLILGAYFVRLTGWRGTVQTIGSLCFLAAPAVFLCAFFFEPAPQRLDRPIWIAGVVSLLIGTALHSLAVWQEPARAETPDA